MDWKLTCIRAVNSVEFIKEVFNNYNIGKPFAITNIATLEEFNEQTGLNADDYFVPEVGKGWMDPKLKKIESNDIAHVIFTSGTEGKPKAIALTHRNLSNVVERLNNEMQLTSEVKEYVGVPIYHSFGLGRCRAIASVGGSFFIPNKGFNLNEIIELLKNEEINSISAVPSLWRIVIDNASLINGLTDGVKWIEIGSEYMTPDEKIKMKLLFPNACIIQHYGLTEASRTSFLNISDAPYQMLESVGKANNGSLSLKIDEDGCLNIKGPHVAPYRVINSEFVDLQDEDGWLKTSDMGSIQNGYFYFKGRADDVINCGGIKFDPSTIEAKINKGLLLEEHVYISRINDPARGDGVLISIQRNNDQQDCNIVSKVDDELSTIGLRVRSAIRIQRIDKIPVTDNGKIKRKQLAGIFARNAKLNHCKKEVDVKDVESLYCRIFNLSNLDLNHSFTTLGGDSLSYISVSIQLEKMLGALPDNWDKMTVKELNSCRSSKPNSSFWSFMEISVFIRFYAICAVVINHSSLPILKGGAVLLLLVSGLNLARFQWNSIINNKTSTFMKSLVTNILIPYWALLFLYPLLKEQSISWSAIFLLENNLPSSQSPPFQAWFISALFQCLILFFLPLTLKRSHLWIKNNAFHYGLIWLLIAILARFLDGHFKIGEEYNLVGGQISWVMWSFALGFLVYQASSMREKLLIMCLVLILPPIFYYGDWSRSITVVIGGICLIWMKNIRVPTLVKNPIAQIAASSLFIYMLHGRAPINSMTSDWQIDAIRIVSGILIGLIVWLIYSRILNRLIKLIHK